MFMNVLSGVGSLCEYVKNMPGQAGKLAGKVFKKIPGHEFLPGVVGLFSPSAGFVASAVNGYADKGKTSEFEAKVEVAIECQQDTAKQLAEVKKQKEELEKANKELKQEVKLKDGEIYVKRKIVVILIITNIASLCLLAKSLQK